jgi:hypothetical protein
MISNNFKLLFFSFFLCLTTFAQQSSVYGGGNEPKEEEIRASLETESEQRLCVQSAVYMQEGYSYYAEIITDKLLEYKPESANYNFRKGALLIQSHTNHVEAMPYLLKAIKNVSKDADLYSARDKNAPMEAYYYLGRAYHLYENIDSAEYYYQMFIDKAPPETDLVGIARLQLKQCGVARREINNPKSAIIENIGPVINTQYPEFSPVIALDGSALYFTARRPWEDNTTEQYRDPLHNHYPEDVYVSYIDFDGSWVDPMRLDFCDGERNEATTSVSADERRIYVYQDDSLANGDIFYSDFGNNRFQKIQDLGDSRINSPYFEPHAMVSADGFNMYFSSNRPGGFGGLDIYRVAKLPDGTWSDPINLGPTVNTPYDEDAPFVAIDNKTMYFSSNGPLSMGGFDVFVTRRLEDGAWSSPINLGYPINSCGDDIYYTTTVDGLRGFITSHRKGGYGEKDIYEIKNDYMGLNAIAVLKGSVKMTDDSQIPEDVSIDITCLDCNDDITRTVFPRLRDGAYFASLEPCHEYELLYTYSDGTKEIFREKVQTSCYDAYDEIFRDILIDIAPNGEITRVNKSNKLKGVIRTIGDKPVPADDIIIKLTCADCADTTSKVLSKQFAQLDANNQPIIDNAKLNTSKPDLGPDYGVHHGKFNSELESCHKYILTAEYVSSREIFYTNKFGTACDDSSHTIFKEIIIPVKVGEETDPTLLSGTVKAIGVKTIPKDLVLELTCLDCEIENEPNPTNPIDVTLKKSDLNGSNGYYIDSLGRVVNDLDVKKRGGDFRYDLEKCHEYQLVCLFDSRSKEVYREIFKTDCGAGIDEVYRDILINFKAPVQDVEVVEAIDYSNPKFKHYFEYNKNKINPKRGEFKKFVGKIETQLQKGRSNMAITIYASASHVPTDKYKTNEALTALRAENIKYDLITYFQENTDFSDRITVVVVEAVVEGPEYKKDWKNRKKYREFQFIRVDTE